MAAKCSAGSVTNVKTTMDMLQSDSAKGRHHVESPPPLNITVIASRKRAPYTSFPSVKYGRPSVR